MTSLASHPVSGHPPPAGMDAAVLQNLLALCGPETGRELLVRIVKDLTTLRHGLVEAANGADSAAIRAHSHVLVAIAGTIGASGLQQMAQDLNDLAQPGCEAAPLWREARAVAAAAAGLVVYVAAISAAPGAPR